jgi:hypothetical protein
MFATWRAPRPKSPRLRPIQLAAAAKKSGVKHYFIEDESADSVNQIPRTLKHLEGVRW